MNLVASVARFPLVPLCCLCLSCAAAVETVPLRQIGVAKIDITPAYPIRLSGYAVRKKESDGVA